MKKTEYTLSFVFPLALAGLLSACSSVPNQAPIVDRHPAPAVVEPVPQPAPPKPVVKVQEPGKTYVVKRGDTLYKIALDHGHSYSDLVVWNNLKNPNDIKVDQVLRVSAPDQSSTGAVQTIPVVGAAGVEVKPLSAPVSGNKTSPKADKRPYSEATLAELQKPELLATTTVARTDVAAPVKGVEKATEKVIEKAPEKPAQPAVADNESVDWVWPVDAKPVATSDENRSKGVDFPGKSGQDILAAGAGRVMYVGSGIRGYGNLVIIRHNSNLLSAYAHNKSIVVKEGQMIAKGQKIAEMGNSDSDNIKLHFEIRLNGKSVDPLKYLPAR
ncbi:peptidoglycan DD-metalloendopeptidase family protein [Undibacterium rugosum]|uniref:Peptidoglycan DD-metalloendopeptidase family protein n=1 Tax=Undibacterium rugosum TaxID=2762291 RepID=A0A923I0U3_9BURK|nr:peptidoglycan DD-metalloendopeptidase family protein [Undibacterium rugosum]MBC3934952.1 peptidoglycan DD-metalloendopeptidase family protein [Undibacterium rugosum]MBR7778187.1 peptidoglycan DD-metalloendopeptidase family protein [Undibacterium rugosum]